MKIKVTIEVERDKKDKGENAAIKKMLSCPYCLGTGHILYLNGERKPCPYCDNIDNGVGYRYRK